MTTLFRTWKIDAEKDDKCWELSHHCIPDEIIDQYAEITGDTNSIHFGPDRIVHGGLLFGKISAVVFKLFGNGTRILGINVPMIKRSVSPNEDFVIAISPPRPMINSPIPQSIEVSLHVYKNVNGHQRNIMSGDIIIRLDEHSYRGIFGL